MPLFVYLFVARGLALGHARALPALVLAGLALDTPLEGTTANAETFMAPLALAGLALCCSTVLAAEPARDRGQHRWRLLAGGLCLGLATLYKVVALCDVAAALALLAWAPAACALGGARWRAPALAGAGVLAPLVATAAAFALQGPAALQALVWATLGYNGAYVQEGAAWVRPAAALALLGALLCLRRYARAAHRRFALLAGLGVWAACAVAGVLAGGRPHAHYALQAVAPLACLCAAALPARVARHGPMLAALLAALWAAVLVGGTALAARGGPAVVARRHRLTAYYAGAWWLATGQEAPRDFAAGLDPRVWRTEDVAATLRRLARGPCAPRTLLVWGNAPWLYYLSGLRPATPYTSTDYQPAPPGEAARLAATMRSRAAGVVVVLDAAHAAATRAATRAGYRVVVVVDGATVLVPAVCRPGERSSGGAGRQGGIGSPPTTPGRAARRCARAGPGRRRWPPAEQGSGPPAGACGQGGTSLCPSVPARCRAPVRP